MSSQPAGWYPNEQGQMQWWDGTAWGQLQQSAAPPPPPAPAGYAQAPYAPGGGYAPAPYAPAYAYGVQQPLPPAIAGQRLASYGQRVGAYIIDVLFCLTLVGAIVDPILMGRDGDRNGMSLGKQVVGIRVAREDGAPVSVGFAFLREWVIRWLLIGFVGSFVFGIPGLIDLLFPLWDKPGEQTLHDKIASTYVTQA